MRNQTINVVSVCIVSKGVYVCIVFEFSGFGFGFWVLGIRIFGFRVYSNPNSKIFRISGITEPDPKFVGSGLDLNFQIFFGFRSGSGMI